VGSGSAWKPWFLVAAGALLYANSLSAPFVFDDLSWINHSRVGEFWSVIASLLDVSRPLLVLSLAFNYAVGGMDPTGYHVFNIGVHVLAALTLYGIARRSFRCHALSERYGDSADSLAFAVALIWIAHPLATQAVTYVIQRAESLMALFYLMTLYCVIRSAASKRRSAWSLTAIVCCALGMQTKEVMVGAPLVVWLYDRAFLAGSFAAALRSRPALYAGLATTWLLLWMTVEPNALSGGVAWAGFGLSEVSAVEYARSQPGVILHYLRLCFWPHPLVLDYGWPAANELVPILWSTALVSVLGLSTLWALWRLPPIGFLGAFFFLVLAPTSSVLPIIDLAFEHRMYLPLAAVVAAVVVAVDAALARASAPTWVGVALLVTIVASLSAATVLRNRDYRSVEVLWRTVVDAAPGNYRGQMNLGAALGELNRNEEALVFLRTAIALAPDHPAAHVNLAAALFTLHQLDESEAHLLRALEISPNHAAARRNYDTLRGKRDELEASIERLRAAVQHGPRDAVAQLNLASALLDIGRRDEALRHFLEAIRLDPYLPKPLAGAARILATHPDPSVRDPAEAVRLAERAAKLSRGQIPRILSTLATAYAAAGQRDRATLTAEQALQRATELGETREAQRIRAQLERYRRDVSPPPYRYTPPSNRRTQSKRGSQNE
jgi:tetratricopeptide (TPR) repeat protein